MDCKNALHHHFEIIDISKTTDDNGNPIDVKSQLLNAFCALNTENPCMVSPNKDLMISNPQVISFFYASLIKNPEGPNIKTIVIEKNYISQSYLDDYINYYAECHRNYSKNCMRLHFFSQHILGDAKDNKCDVFKKYIENPDYEKDKTFWESYQGYVAIKPLENHIIGATILKPYNKVASNGKGTRHFPATKKYNVNLFGKHLTIKTMAYAQQDHVTGCCASLSLWFLYHRMSKLFLDIPCPSPSDITLLAGYGGKDNGKIFPTRELTTGQIVNVLKETNLECLIVSGERLNEDHDRIKRLIYAYLKSGFPILVGINIDSATDFTDSINNHLVTINGYRIKKNNDSHFKADNIETFYAHDDGVGPFTQFYFNKEKTTITTSWLNEKDPEFTILTSTKKFEDAHNYLNRKAKIINVIIPLPKIFNVSFYGISNKFKFISSTIKENNAILKGNKYQVNIFIQRSNKYKRNFFANTITTDKKLLFENLPKYIWVYRISLINSNGNNIKILDLLFDSIDASIIDKPLFKNQYNASHFENFKNDIQSQIDFRNTHYKDESDYFSLIENLKKTQKFLNDLNK